MTEQEAIALQRLIQMVEANTWPDHWPFPIVDVWHGVIVGLESFKALLYAADLALDSAVEGV